MITDIVALNEIRQSWRGIEALRDKLQRAILGSIASGGNFALFASDAAHNLPFVHAYAVLNDVLEQLAQENQFQCKSIFLGTLLDASKNILPWANFTLLKKGADRRNDVAHRGDVLPRGECWQYIDAIKNELISWKIL
jgi:hypothetical protein